MDGIFNFEREKLIQCWFELHFHLLMYNEAVIHYLIQELRYLAEKDNIECRIHPKGKISPTQVYKDGSTYKLHRHSINYSIAL